MHVSQITELYSSSQFSESLILRQILNSNGDSYLSAVGKIRKGMGYSSLRGHKSTTIPAVRRPIGPHKEVSMTARLS